MYNYNISSNLIVDAAQLSGDSYWLPNKYNIFFKMVAFEMDSYHERRYWEIWVG